MGARSRGYSFKDEKLEALKMDINIIIKTFEIKYNIPRLKTIELSGMSQANFYKAMHDPALFRIGQLHRIYEGLHVPEEERRYA